MSAFYNNERINNTNFLSSYGSNGSYGSYGYGSNGYSNYGNGRGIEAGFKSFINFISNHKFGTIGFLCFIPILAFIIIGFINNQYILGCISISFLFTVIILLASIAYKTIKISQFILLIFLLFLQFGFIVYFLTKTKKKVSNDMYLNFYDKVTFAKKTGIPLSFYQISGNNDAIIDTMKGTKYNFALKEDMQIDLGNEATYSFWLKVCPNNFNKGNSNWRTVWYRGDIDTDSMYQRKTPGVYLAPNTNKLIITVACENGPDEGNAIVLDDIPLNNWFCITIVLDGRSLECYMNGLLERSISLTGMPLMMNSNLVKGKNGFNGLIAFFRYNSAAMESMQIKKLYDREKATIEGTNYDLETCFEVK